MTRSTRKIASFALASMVAASFAAGAIAAPGKGKGPSWKGGKKPVGTIASFADPVLTVDMNDGSQFVGNVTEDTQIKLDHRGRPSAKGNPTQGSTADLVAGYLVLRIKSDESDAGVVVEKIKVRKVAAPAPTPTPTPTS